MQIENLFSEPVAVFDSFRPLVNSELLYLEKELQSTRPNTSNRTSDNSYILRAKELAELNAFCLNALSEYTTEIYGKPIDLRITQSWLNITKDKQFHHMHSHSNSVISGVYYIETTESDKIQFERSGGSGSYDIFVSADSWNRWNSKSWWLPTPQGSLILFPSTLRHQVPALSRQGSRISLAFNTFFSGSFGEPLAFSYVDMP